MPMAFLEVPIFHDKIFSDIRIVGLAPEASFPKLTFDRGAPPNVIFPFNKRRKRMKSRSPTGDPVVPLLFCTRLESFPVIGMKQMPSAPGLRQKFFQCTVSIIENDVGTRPEFMITRSKTETTACGCA